MKNRDLKSGMPKAIKCETIAVGEWGKNQKHKKRTAIVSKQTSSSTNNSTNNSTRILASLKLIVKSDEFKIVLIISSLFLLLMKLGEMYGKYIAYKLWS